MPTWRRVARIALIGASALGWGIAAAAMILIFMSDGSGVGSDSHAYWLAGARALGGEPLYLGIRVDELGAYFYPPFFAQLWAPLSVAPEVLVAWGWRIVGVLSIRYMAGSWLFSGVWFLYPGTLTELGAGNVTFQVAALTVAGLRGRAEGVLPATMVKFGSVMVIPFIWFCRPLARRGLIVGGVIAFGLVFVSAIVAPQSWRDYLDALTSQSGLSFEGTPILHLLPSAGADYALRIGVAVLIVTVSVWKRSARLAYVAALIATPTLWPQRLALLFALPTLQNDDWVKRLLRGRDEHDA
jgi:hypothetical protein